MIEPNAILNRCFDARIDLFLLKGGHTLRLAGEWWAIPKMALLNFIMPNIIYMLPINVILYGILLSVK